VIELELQVLRLPRRITIGPNPRSKRLSRRGVWHIRRPRSQKGLTYCSRRLPSTVPNQVPDRLEALVALMRKGVTAYRPDVICSNCISACEAWGHQARGSIPHRTAP